MRAVGLCRGLRLFLRVFALTLGAYLAGFVLFDIFGPAPEIGCGVLLLGSVTPTTAVVLVRVCEEPEGVLEIASSGRRAAPDVRFQDVNSAAYLGSVEFDQLSPDTEYIVSNGKHSVGFRTFPSPQQDASPNIDDLLLVFGSCSSVTSWPWNSLHAPYNRMMELKPRFGLFLGDNAYVDVHEALPWYRIPFETAHLRVVAQPAVLGFMQKVPSFTMWDDHEVENDFQGGMEHKYASAGLEAFLKYWGQRNPGRHMKPETLFYSFDYGSLASFFVLETRLNYRPEAGRFLGDKQMSHLLQWLESKSKSKTRHIIIASPMSWSTDGYGDTFAQDRDKIFAHVAKLRLCNVIILSGDMHYGAAYIHEHGRILEFSASPFQALPFYPDPDPHDDPSRGYKRIFIHGGPRFNFGALRLGWNNGTFEVYSWPSLRPWQSPRLLDSYAFNQCHYASTNVTG